MTLVSRRCYVVGCLVVLSLLWATAWPGAAAAQTPGLPVDPALHRGTLDNGVTYWVRSHATPPGKITFWLHVDTGSLNEADGQEGMAHYLEHMAFNGTANFPPGQLLPYFESIGLRFGQHQNAFTSFDQTTYTLTLPNTQTETLDKGLLCLADFAFRMRLVPAEIDKERGVILEEKRASKGVAQRLIEKLLPALWPDSRVVRRLPIGLEANIRRFQRQDFLAYYTTWYHPARVTVLAVGNAPVETIVAAITRHFAGWQHPEPPPIPREAVLTPYQAPRAFVVTDPELTSANVELIAVRPAVPVLTEADFRQRLMGKLGTWMVNRRIEQRIQEGTAPYQSASTHTSRFLGVARQASAEAEADPAQWQAAFKGLITDVQRARLHGFTTRELDMARKATLASAERAVQTESTRDANFFIVGMNRALSAGQIPRSAAQDLALLQRLLPGISTGEVGVTFADLFTPHNKAYVLSLPETEGLAVPSSEALLAMIQTVLAQPVVAWEDHERPTALLAQDPQPGVIVEQTHFAPLDVTQVAFANHVRLHYRFVDFKKDHVTVIVTLPGGLIREGAEQRGITAVAALPLQDPATSQFSSTDIRDLMTGKQIWIRGRVAEDAVELRISGAPEALEDGLRLAYLLLQDAKIEPASVALWQHQRLQEIAALRTHIRSRAKEAARQILSGNDPRQALLTAAQINARATAIPEAQAWLNTLLRSAPMEVAIVGDIPVQTALALASKYFGSLPDRPRYDPSLEPLRQIAGFHGPLRQTVEVETITPRAHPILLWRSAPWKDVRERRLMYLASRILERRIRQQVREEHALTYSTATYARPSRVYPDMSALYVEFSTDPDKAEEAATLAQAVVEQFAAEGPTAAEMETMRKQVRNSLETALQEPGFWVELLSDLDYHHNNLEDVDGLIDKLMAFSRADISAVLQQMLVPEHFATVLARPKAPLASSQQTPLQPELPDSSLQ